MALKRGKVWKKKKKNTKKKSNISTIPSKTSLISQVQRRNDCLDNTLQFASQNVERLSMISSRFAHGVQIW